MFEPNFNRDSNTHMEHQRDEISNVRETTGWEEDLIEAELQ